MASFVLKVNTHTGGPQILPFQMPEPHGSPSSLTMNTFRFKSTYCARRRIVVASAHLSKDRATSPRNKAGLERDMNVGSTDTSTWAAHLSDRSDGTGPNVDRPEETDPTQRQEPDLDRVSIRTSFVISVMKQQLMDKLKERNQTLEVTWSEPTEVLWRPNRTGSLPVTASTSDLCDWRNKGREEGHRTKRLLQTFGCLLTDRLD